MLDFLTDRPFRAPKDEPPRSTDDQSATVARPANRFDIRRIIATLFALYGVVLLVTGLVGSHGVKTKASGIDIDLWTGLGMLVVAALMITWALSRPLEP